MRNRKVSFLVFLICNFLALIIGSWLMNNGPRSDWYLALNKAPWTPPGYMFGLAWSIIMICFAFYMNRLSFQFKLFNKKLIILYTIQWILNVGWNFTFFNQKKFLLGLIILLLLWLLLVYLFNNYRKKLRKHSLWIFPYIIWMTIAISLNAYVVLYN